jgi:drug/metabolite transporter (DMT)-like permease
MRLGTPPIKAATIVFIFTAVIAVCVCDPSDLVIKAAAKPAVTLPLIIGIGVVTFVLPYLCYTVAMKHLDAGTVSALGIVEPMSATLFGVALFSEKLDIFSGAGILLILTAVLLLSRNDGSNARAERKIAKKP